MHACSDSWFAKWFFQLFGFILYLSTNILIVVMNLGTKPIAILLVDSGQICNGKNLCFSMLLVFTDAPILVHKTNKAICWLHEIYPNNSYQRRKASQTKLLYNHMKRFAVPKDSDPNLPEIPIKLLNTNKTKVKASSPCLKGFLAALYFHLLWPQSVWHVFVGTYPCASNSARILHASTIHGWWFGMPGESSQPAFGFASKN